MRRFLVVIALTVGACGSFVGTETDVDPPLPDAGTDAAVDSAPSADAGDGGRADAAADGSGCQTATETLDAAHDAILTTDPGHQDLSDNGVCNLNIAHCLVSFDLGASVSKTIVGLTLMLPRATGNECGGPCDTVQFRQAGRISVAHMRSDWTDAATWFRRTNDDLQRWNADGASSALDVAVAVAGVHDVLPAENAISIKLDVTALSKLWLSQPLLAFRTAPVASFHFVLQRKLSAAPAAARLIVTYCR
jgi:hypothetical protein